MDRPVIEPLPPVAAGLGVPWDVEVSDPVAAIGAARAELGDTFVVDSGRDRFLFTFSPTGVASFYALGEEQASKGLADYRMLRRKLPDEVFADRRTFPHELFGRDDVTNYLSNVRLALDATIDELGSSGTVDVFALTRRLGHRVGLASWGGPGAAAGDRFDRLVEQFDALDGADAFVHPDAMAAVAASGKATEKAALEAIVVEMADVLAALPRHEDEHPLFTRVANSWRDEVDDVRIAGVAGDVTLVHIASMSNLFAALGWALVDLLEHPGVDLGDHRAVEQCMLESTRLAQRSIMSRYVHAPVELDDGDHVYNVSPGVTIATLLPLTNTSAAPGLDVWQPARWKGRRLRDANDLPTPELVTAFGHGRHTCPAQPFSLASMTTAVTRLFETYELTPRWTGRPTPVPAQIGGVARAEAPCVVEYRRR